MRKTAKAFGAGKTLPSEHPLVGATDFLGGKAFTTISK